MAFLVSDLINNTLANINAIAVGGAAATEDQTLALVYINQHLDSLNATVKKSLFATYDPILFTFNAVANFAALGDTVTLPAGWARALQYMAAIDLAPAFGRPIGQDLVKLATEAKAAILTLPGAPPTATA